MKEFLSQTGYAALLMGLGCIIVSAIFLDFTLAMIGTGNLLIGLFNLKRSEMFEG